MQSAYTSNKLKVFLASSMEQEAQGLWHSAWTQDPVSRQDCFEKF